MKQMSSQYSIDTTVLQPGILVRELPRGSARYQGVSCSSSGDNVTRAEVPLQVRSLFVKLVREFYYIILGPVESSILGALVYRSAQLGSSSAAALTSPVGRFMYRRRIYFIFYIAPACDRISNFKVLSIQLILVRNI